MTEISPTPGALPDGDPALDTEDSPDDAPATKARVGILTIRLNGEPPNANIGDPALIAAIIGGESFGHPATITSIRPDPDNPGMWLVTTTAT